MPFIRKESIARTVSGLRAGLIHAFATPRQDQPLSVEEAALVDRVATVIVTRGMAAPATVFLESLGPMNFLGSQALHFLTPIIELAFQTREIEHVARLLERRDTVTRLMTLIEAKSAR